MSDSPLDSAASAVRPSVADRLGAAWPPALAGLAAGGAALAVGELIAGLIKDAPSLVTAVGSLVIALQPSGAKELMVNLFGTNDKLVLNLAVLVVALVIALFTGTVAGRNFRNGAWVFVGFGVIAAFAGYNEALTSRIFDRRAGRRGRGWAGGPVGPARPRARLVG